MCMHHPVHWDQTGIRVTVSLCTHCACVTAMCMYRVEWTSCEYRRKSEGLSDEGSAPHSSHHSCSGNLYIRIPHTITL